ncbi:response regulator transcription factor [Clostridium sp. A1-XYC3]|uniref:Stage 0 sporulation protein A homolog n=1 Tax=Clostridium tanneri TaxID=3037988 RepID=A0ABU4JPC4_9CLOT|nr:response regulator transcription factor [Clostridium sp. A1-XYC3]MDW8799977.1 response regulator transcription factor [Clostridium sp. A1-XYC3]
MKFRILVIEDEFSISDILTFSLKGEGYEVKSSFSSKEAREILEKFKPHIVLLDVNLPDESGFELCKFINSNYKIPIIMITARTDIIDKVLGLELGADDYITKPFHIKEVLARVKVALRRVDKYKSDNEENNFIEINSEVKVDLEKRIVTKNEEIIRLRPKEYDLLVFFIKNKNIVFTREQILDRVWGIDYIGETRTVDIHVRRLRAKLNLENGQTFIETIFGVGYAMR